MRGFAAQEVLQSRLAPDAASHPLQLSETWASECTIERLASTVEERHEHQHQYVR